MWRIVSLLVTVLVAEVCIAAANIDLPYELKATDHTGCYITDGHGTWPTIGMMVAFYDNPESINQTAVNALKAAIGNGCDINEPDKIGLSPLNASILFNQPILVAILLESGANPEKIIVSRKEKLNGLNTFSFLDLLIESDSQKDRRRIKNMLAPYK